MRKQNAESQKKEKKDKAVKKLLKKMAYDREKHEKQDKVPNDVRKHLKYYVNKITISSEKVAIAERISAFIYHRVSINSRLIYGFHSYGLPA